MKKKMIFLICFLFCLSLAMPVSAQAAEKKEATIYREFLKENPLYDWFRTLDINKDGVKELIVSKKQLEYSSNVYYVYTIKKNEIVYIGKVSHSQAFKDGKSKVIFYNSKLKAIRKAVTAPMGFGLSLYKISGSTLKETIYMNRSFGRFPVYSIGKNGKDKYYTTASEIKKFNKLVDGYFYKGCKKYILYKNTAANRLNKL